MDNPKYVSFKNGIRRLSAKSNRATEALNLQSEANQFLAALKSYPTQLQKVSQHVLKTTKGLSQLTKEVQKTHDKIVEIRSEMNKTQCSAEQMKQKKAELQVITKGFVETIVDNEMERMMDRVDAVLELIDQVRLELKDLNVPKHAEFGYLWLEAVYKSGFEVKTCTDNWES
ncbi:hypothetical protein L211DRAFT_846881 [Terfezia boudieri ATCC MYA-4762]|uniref:Uncharacterized protein n=1 Tax=Terfezia boudieri ATCC MYA-4762 TaxID=1051890 RepID=A0A3N4LUX5_9PEZI|nr:hypothetical protein L211DRAFT_846881 [Terfezia boudieri ATCC MYA-4762]